MNDITQILDEIEKRALESHGYNLNDIAKIDVPALVKALRYCQGNIINNLPSIARITFTEKVAAILTQK